jgi:hypothetical protein
MLLALGATLSSPQPARAAEPLAVSVYCEGTGGSIYANFFCDAYPSGGTGGETYTWSGNSYATFTFISGDFASGRCRVGYTGRITVTVRDSSGATASASPLFRCYGSAP